MSRFDAPHLYMVCTVLVAVLWFGSIAVGVTYLGYGIATADWPEKAQPAATAASEESVSDCHPSYRGACLDPDAIDYDCSGGEGNGPKYVGFVEVVGFDDYGLDADGDGSGCE